MKTKMSYYKREGNFLAPTEWIYKTKQTFELIIASGEHLFKVYVIYYEAWLFKVKALDWWLLL